jgi:hypothetical protein
VTNKRPVTIGRHSGITGQGGLRTGCMVALLVGTNSVLEVELLGGDENDQPCEIVNRIATAIEPRLP